MAGSTPVTSLVDRVRDSARALSVAARWVNNSAIRVQDDFIYEMFLLFEIVKALQDNYAVEYIPGTGDTTHEFPKKGTSKSGRPRFHVIGLESGICLIQICAGTRVLDPSGKERAFDLSFQSGDACETPTYAEVKQIFDAKLRKSHDRRITHPEFAAFSHWVELFGLREHFAPPLDLGSLSDINANCLVTNGQTSTEEDVERQRVGVTEVSNFYPGQSHSARP